MGGGIGSGGDGRGEGLCPRPTPALLTWCRAASRKSTSSAVTASAADTLTRPRPLPARAEGVQAGRGWKKRECDGGSQVPAARREAARSQRESRRSGQLWSSPEVTSRPIHADAMARRQRDAVGLQLDQRAQSGTRDTENAIACFLPPEREDSRRRPRGLNKMAMPLSRLTALRPSPLAAGPSGRARRPPPSHAAPSACCRTTARAAKPATGLATEEDRGVSVLTGEWHSRGRTGRGRPTFPLSRRHRPPPGLGRRRLRPPSLFRASRSGEKEKKSPDRREELARFPGGGRGLGCLGQTATPRPGRCRCPR